MVKTFSTAESRRVVFRREPVDETELLPTRGIDLETKEIDFNSFINIRPRDNNTKNEIQSETIKQKYFELSKIFFQTIFMSVLLLAGSLSNDLFRVATLTQRGSIRAAHRFFVEAQRWAQELAVTAPQPYIQKIAADVSASSLDDLTEAVAERYLMYGVLLQNYCLHHQSELSGATLMRVSPSASQKNSGPKG